MVDGAHNDQLKAEGLWQKLRDLPYDEQCQQVRRYRFCSTVLFDLLRQRSRREGRKDRQRGVEMAKLALVSLKGGDQTFGDRIHDLRALGWAWVGNAHRLAFDFPAASAAFEQAEREWALPRAQPDRLVLAHICLRKGALRLMQREFAQATEDLNCSCALFRQSEQTEDEALALIERATMHGYAGRLHDAVEDLREAEGLVDESEDKELAFAVRGNLANALVRASQAESAAAELSSARRLALELDDPLGAIQLDWIEGDLGELPWRSRASKALLPRGARGIPRSG